MNARDDAAGSTVGEAVAALARGEIVVVVDDPERENEGDLVMAAEHVSADAINFMATEGRGLICVPMNADRLDQLEIPPMVQDNRDPHGTAFRVGVDRRGGWVSTGISASDRAATIKALANPASGAQSFSRPGHVFPLASQPGGVRERRGHTEATIELLRLAGLREVGVICEIASRSGEMMRYPDLVRFAELHGLVLLKIADLVTYLDEQELDVERIATTRLPLAQGDFTMLGYRDRSDERAHLVVTAGVVEGHRDVLVHLHAECFGGDVLGSTQCGCRAELDRALLAIAAEDAGIVIYLRGHESTAERFFGQLAHGLADSGSAHGSPPRALHRHLIKQRDYRATAQILRDLRIDGVRLLVGDHRDCAALERLGVRVELVQPQRSARRPRGTATNQMPDASTIATASAA